jgi:peroxiredoxin
MKYLRRLNVLAVILLLFSLPVIQAQVKTENPDESAAIKKAALDYIDGYYSGDVVRMERAIHPDINKATPRDLPQTGRTILTYSTYSGLIENTRAKVGALDEKARNIQVQILNINNDVANVKVISANFIDYIQEVKLDGQWKIINDLYTSGTGVPPRLKDFNAETERAAIEQTALDYLAGITGGDAARLEITLSPEFNRITLNPIAATGRTSLRRQRYASIIENTLARVGKQDEIYRNNHAAIFDITDGLAVIRCDQIGTYEFVQMFKNGGQWKILNSIAKPNTGLTIAQAMTAIVGNPMPDFTLPIYGGGEFTLSKYHGKNVMLMFPRGWLGAIWCSYCPYQYLELEQLEKISGIKTTNNLEIAFVLPYSSDRIKDWMEKFLDALQTIETIKNPQPQPAAGSLQADYSAWARKSFLIKFEVKKDDSHNVIPVLVDENRTLSRQVKTFTSFWDGITSEQNMAAVFIIDKNGILRFKYISQMTEDRPSVEFLLEFIQRMQ